MADVVALGWGRYLVADGARRRRAYAAGPPESRWVFLEGRVYVIDTRRAGRDQPVRAREDHLGLSAPMPATVTSINVTEGQFVSQGDVLIVLEAMKMEMPIRAPRSGRVVRIACSVGELVDQGAILVHMD